MEITIDIIKESISQLFGFNIIEENSEMVKYKISEEITAVLDKNNLNNLITEISHNAIDDDLGLYHPSYFEILLRNENRFFSHREINTVDYTNNLDYQIERPSNKYLVMFLYKSHRGNTRDTYRLLRISSHMLAKFDSTQPSLFENDILEIIGFLIPSLKTIQIANKSGKAKSKEEFEQLMYSFLFHLGYNNDSTYTPIRFIEEFIQPYRLRFRRNGLSELEPPRKKYTNDLVLHYQKGISSDSIDHQYVSFYHVLEHFFEKVYTDDIINTVKNELTNPGFSYKRRKDIYGLVDIIQKKLKYKNDEFQINEIEALELTLKKFFSDFTELKNELNKISTDFIEHYKSNEVRFSKGNRVNFDNPNIQNVFSDLTKRIYFTRNAIVHSKETDKIKFMPFRDDKDLLLEIPLMRVIAELIIIGTSQEI